VNPRAFLVGLLLLGGCAGGPSAPRGPVVSPTGIVYPPGVPPTESRYSQTAALYLRSGEADRALTQALEGISADPGNPRHHFLAGVAYARLGRYEEADRALDRAQEIYPAYELDIEPERLAAWAEAFNAGTEAYADGRDEDAIEAWRGAAVVYRLRPEAHGNLGMLLAQRGEVEDAIDVYEDLVAGLELVPATRVLTVDEVAERDRVRAESERRLADLLLMAGRFERAETVLRSRLDDAPDDAALRLGLASALGGQGRSEGADSIYHALLAERGLDETQLYNLGVALFRASAPERAAEAFRRLTDMRPQSRDAWFNYANALLAASDWAGLVEASDPLLTLDPLGEGSALLVARAHLESGDEQAALAELSRIDAAPAHVEGLTLQTAGSVSTVSGRIVGNSGEVGAPLRLRFTFYGSEGTTRADTVLSVPEHGAAEPFEVSVRMRATAYRYQLVGAAAGGR
jgi:tetratricopeptide (TPR) repeat protein